MWTINKFLLNTCCLLACFSYLVFVFLSLFTGVFFALAILAAGV